MLLNQQYAQYYMSVHFFPKPGHQGSLLSLTSLSLRLEILEFSSTLFFFIFLVESKYETCWFFFCDVLTFIMSSSVSFLGFKLGTVARSLHLPAVWFPQNLSLHNSACPIPLLASLIHVAFRDLSLLIQPFASSQISPAGSHRLS